MVKKESSFHNNFLVTKELAFDPCSLDCLMIEVGVENIEYGAYAFQINGLNIQFRVAKVTPKKAGLFVAVYKRMSIRIIVPYDACDAIDLCVISVGNGTILGNLYFQNLF